MEDRDFFDLLYQGWSKTTGAEDTFWMQEENPDYDTKRNYTWDLFAVGADEGRTFLGGFKNEADAAFITAVHGCFGDLCRRLHEALDESDRLLHERDSQECRIAELVMEIQELKGGGVVA